MESFFFFQLQAACSVFAHSHEGPCGRLAPRDASHLRIFLSTDPWSCPSTATFDNLANQSAPAQPPETCARATLHIQLVLLNEVSSDEVAWFAFEYFFLRVLQHHLLKELPRRFGCFPLLGLTLFACESSSCLYLESWTLWVAFDSLCARFLAKESWRHFRADMLRYRKPCLLPARVTATNVPMDEHVVCAT